MILFEVSRAKLVLFYRVPPTLTQKEAEGCLT
jgi:hypothetical protein